MTRANLAQISTPGGVLCNDFSLPQHASLDVITLKQEEFGTSRLSQEAEHCPSVSSLSAIHRETRIDYKRIVRGGSWNNHAVSEIPCALLQHLAYSRDLQTFVMAQQELAARDLYSRGSALTTGEVSR